MLYKWLDSTKKTFILGKLRAEPKWEIGILSEKAADISETWALTF